MLLAAASAVADEPTYAERLGWPTGSRVVIFHVDDAGMSHDSNMGAIEAIEKGVATSVSIMFPCSWVSEMAHYIKEHPTMDAGIHTTLTSEWKNYRWGPLAGKRLVPSMVDKEGCLWSGLTSKNMPKANEVDIELRGRIGPLPYDGHRADASRFAHGRRLRNPGVLHEVYAAWH